MAKHTEEEIQREPEKSRESAKYKAGAGARSDRR